LKQNRTDRSDNPLKQRYRYLIKNNEGKGIAAEEQMEKAKRIIEENNRRTRRLYGKTDAYKPDPKTAI